MTLAISLVTLVTQCLAELDLQRLSDAEVVIVAKVRAASPAFISLRRGAMNALGASTATYAVYTVTGALAIKGNAPSELSVQGASSLATNGWGPSAQQKLANLSLPADEWVLLYLQLPHDSKFRLSMQTTLTSGYVTAPDGVGYALMDFDGLEPPAVISSSAMPRLHLKRDFPGRDVARVLLLSQGADESGFACLIPDPIVPLLLSGKEFADLARLLGPNPHGFYRDQLLPELPSLAQDSGFGPWVDRLILSGSWGDPDAAGKIASAVVARGSLRNPDEIAVCVRALHNLRDMVGADEAFGQLLLSPISDVREVAITGLAGSKKYRPEVRRFLDSAEPGILRAAMFSLATTDDDSEHFPKMGDDDDFGPGSQNSKLLAYWRSKG